MLKLMIKTCSRKHVLALILTLERALPELLGWGMNPSPTAIGSLQKPIRLPGIIVYLDHNQYQQQAMSFGLLAWADGAARSKFLDDQCELPFCHSRVNHEEDRSNHEDLYCLFLESQKSGKAANVKICPCG